ncbi:hypothetical protein OAF47_01950, partial [bacterium]|nr:hypothetical protein [bacterium]
MTSTHSPNVIETRLKRDCNFCQGNLTEAYQLNEYSLVYCTGCGTICVRDMPNAASLKSYYQGFNF